MVAYIDKYQRKNCLVKILKASAIMRGSTWRTSAIGSDLRAFTLCNISKTGDI